MSEIVFTQQALEAWLGIQPDGVYLPLHKLPNVIETLKVPLGPEEVLHIFESFTGDVQDKNDTGEASISFFVFWKAWNHLARLGEETMESTSEDHLFLELQTLRDSLLRFSALERSDFPIEYLSREIDRSEKISDFPAFWNICRDSLNNLDERLKIINSSSSTNGNSFTSITMEEVTMLLISWLLDAISFTRERELAAAKEREIEADRERRKEEQIKGLPVYIHVYDVSQEASIRKLNRFTANKFSPVKFGGVFHAGVEVAKLEWSYGASMVESMPGIVCHEVKTHPQHRYRQTIFMGFTRMTSEEVADLIGCMVELYPGSDYELLRRNCCHFADDFCQKMGVGRIPGWIYRFARVGAGFDTMIQTLRCIRGGGGGDDDEERLIDS